MRYQLKEITISDEHPFVSWRGQTWYAIRDTKAKEYSPHLEEILPTLYRSKELALSILSRKEFGNALPTA